MLEEINKRHIVIVDPEIGKRKISVNENLQDYFEAIVILKKTSEFVEKKHYINNVTLAIKQNMGSLKKLWGSIILSFAIEVCSLILPICTQIIIDVAIGRGNYDIILLVFLLGIGAVLLYGVLSYLKSNIILSMSYDFWKNFSEDIIKKLFHLPISYFDIRSSGDISNRINNINLIKDTMARIGNSLIINCLSILVFGIAMMCMSIRLSLVIYGIAIFQAVFFYFCMKHTRRLMHENLERQEVTYTYLLEVLKNILFIKSSDSSIDSRVIADDIESAVSNFASVSNYIAKYHSSFSGFGEHLKDCLIEDILDVNAQSLKENICIDIFNRTTNIKLIDQYKAFQILSENWETITADLEMIQGEGFDAIFQVDPNMVVKKKKEDEDEVTEVQEGWKGHILPFELVQEEFHHGELFAIQSGEERLVEISNMYTEILESLEEDELEQTITTGQFLEELLQSRNHQG